MSGHCAASTIELPQFLFVEDLAKGLGHVSRDGIEAVLQEHQG